MEPCAQILAEYLAKIIHVEELIDAEKIVHDKCYQALCKIKEILENDVLEDAACFYKIEEIVCALEELGSDAGARHDFG